MATSNFSKVISFVLRSVTIFLMSFEVVRSFVFILLSNARCQPSRNVENYLYVIYSRGMFTNMHRTILTKLMAIHQIFTININSINFDSNTVDPLGPL